ncbi:hypothetical protein [Nonomuraea sp. NPDC049646]|uniref:hypothetical protein n=1 Tax=unclassified Nonomuraea TaxID=2593643 RepID=UPI00379E6774
MELRDLHPKRWKLHHNRMTKAAGISQVGLVCHIDTWSYITKVTRFAVTPTPTTSDEVMVRVPLSGPALVTVLAAMRTQVRYYSTPDIAIARRVYAAFAEVVDAVDPAAKDGPPIPDVVLDDKLGPAPG